MALGLTRDQELWGLALEVERQHGANGWFHIAQEQDRLLAEGDVAGAAMWQEIGKRYDQLRPKHMPVIL